MSLPGNLEPTAAPTDQLLTRATQAAQATRTGAVKIKTPIREAADRLKITYPGDDAEWIPQEEIDVTWNLLGEVSGPLDVTLVRRTAKKGKKAADFGQLAFFLLASGIDPQKKRVTIQVPDVPPGADYAISISNTDPLTVYSDAVTIAYPA